MRNKISITCSANLDILKELEKRQIKNTQVWEEGIKALGILKENKKR